MRIVHLLYSFGTGGMEKGIVTLVQNTHEQIEHIILCLSTSGESEKKLPAGTQVISLRKPKGNSLAFIFNLARRIRTLSPDVVHTRNWSGLDGVIAARIAGIRSIVHGEHGWGMDDPLGQSRKRKIIRKALSMFIREFICVSKQMESWLIHDIGISKPVTQIYNGIDHSLYRPGDTRRKDIKTIGVIGRLDPIKDHPTLFKAFDRIVRNMPNVELLVVGDGPERQKLEAMAGPNIRFLGNRQDVSELLQQMDLFVLPSFNEGISNTILEAMAVGLPVIATRVGGNPELVVDGITGNLFEPGHWERLADLMEKYLKNSALRQTTGEAGRQSVVHRFSTEKMVDQYVSVWKRVTPPFI